jgi:pSer/pThr/pTyr-binding forkhead associated (FHA) protein
VAGRVFALSFGRHLIGRSAETGIQLPEASVSLRHAEVDVRPDGVQLMNLISTNGTWLNGAQVHTGRLRHGDIIRLGRVTLQFHDALPTTQLRRRRIGLALAGLLAGCVFVMLLWQTLG